MTGRIASADLRLIIFGGRDFTDEYLAFRRIDYYLSLKAYTTIEIVSGRCPFGKLTFTTEEGIAVYGADGIGEKYAHKCGYPVKAFTAEWGKHGRGAGPIRNRAMGGYGTHAIGFWDGISRGTADMIGVAKHFGLPTKVVYYG